jgi:ADP-ribosyltransferase exoenzyme
MRLYEFYNVNPVFRGLYPSIETRLGEATPDLTKYSRQQQTDIHKQLDIAGDQKPTKNYDEKDEKDWNDLDYAVVYSGDSRPINHFLHQHYRNKLPKNKNFNSAKDVEALDRLIANHKLKHQLVVYTGVKESPADAWLNYKADITKPIRLHLPAYTSTTTNIKRAYEFSDPEVVLRKRHQPRNKDAPPEEFGVQVLMITIPPGNPAASLKKISEWPHENEIILPRGLDIEIDPRPTILKNNAHVWHTQVIGHNPVQIAPAAN